MHLTLGPAAIFILEAFVAIREGKLSMLRIGLSINYRIAKGPSRESKGSLGKAIVPGKKPLTLILLQSSFLSQSINASGK
jgi:hypothetical protein